MIDPEKLGISKDRVFILELRATRLEEKDWDLGLAKEIMAERLRKYYGFEPLTPTTVAMQLFLDDIHNAASWLLAGEAMAINHHHHLAYFMPRFLVRAYQRRFRKRRL